MSRHATRISPGQLLIIGFDGVEINSRLASLLTKIQPAGVILFARNIKSAPQTWQLLRDCQKCVEQPLFTCVDLEGGSVDRFRGVLGPTPSAGEVYATGDRRLFRKHGDVIGNCCRALGFNVDFAPVLDLAFEASHSVLGSRAVSANAKETVKYAREFLAGLGAAKIMGCGKHFPGLGEGKLDSHHELPVIEKSLKKLWSEDLVPYRTLRRQLPMVMVSHAAYPQVTKAASPASISKMWIADVLKKRIGYKNLILSDDLEMGGVLSAVPVGEAALQFVAAGGDICLVCHREDYILQAYEALIKKTENDRTFAKRVVESSRRITSFKKKWATNLRCSKQPTGPAVAKLTRKLWEFGEQVRLENLNRDETTRKPNPA